jgi:hypothetical protein
MKQHAIDQTMSLADLDSDEARRIVRAGLRGRIAQIRAKHFGPLDLFRTERANDYTFGALFLEKTAR